MQVMIRFLDRGLAVWCSAVALLMGGACYAETVAEPGSYTFRGHEGGLFGRPVGMTLEGGFNLGPNSVGVTNISPDGQWISISYSSSPNQIWGTYGEWTFSGEFTVNVSHGPVWIGPGQDNMAPDHWILRSTISGGAHEGWSPQILNIFYSSSPGSIDPPSMYPPHALLMGAYGNPEDFQFVLGFGGISENARDDYGIMLAIPEPSAGSLVVLGWLGLGWWRFRNKRGGGGNRIMTER